MLYVCTFIVSRKSLTSLWTINQLRGSFRKTFFSKDAHPPPSSSCKGSGWRGPGRTLFFLHRIIFFINGVVFLLNSYSWPFVKHLKHLGVYTSFQDAVFPLYRPIFRLKRPRPDFPFVGRSSAPFLRNGLLFSAAVAFLLQMGLRILLYQVPRLIYQYISIWHFW